MNFGIGLSDCVMIVQALCDGIRLLSGEAVRSFKKHIRVYNQFASLAGRLSDYIDQDINFRTPFFEATLRDIENTLHDFFSKIQDLRPYLGHERNRRSFRAAIRKIRWSSYSATLDELRLDLKSQMEMITFELQLQNG